MRKDGKSQYQIKKEKLLKIKNIMIDEIITNTLNFNINLNNYKEVQKRLITPLNKIWEIVKDEKNND